MFAFHAERQLAIDKHLMIMASHYTTNPADLSAYISKCILTYLEEIRRKSSLQ